MSEKIQPQHLARKAALYVRQSPAFEVMHNQAAVRHAGAYSEGSPAEMPPSPSFRIATICDSVNLDFFISSPVLCGSPTFLCSQGGRAYE